MYEEVLEGKDWSEEMVTDDELEEESEDIEGEDEDEPVDPSLTDDEDL
jgi:hypothetical protein